MSSLLDSFDNAFKSNFSFLDNQYVSGTLSLLLILYASSVAPKLPNYVAKWMDNIVVRGIVFFLIVYLTQKNPSLALIVSLAVLVTLMVLSKNKSESMDNLTDVKIGDVPEQMMHQNTEYVLDREKSVISGQEPTTIDNVVNKVKEVVADSTDKVKELVEESKDKVKELVGEKKPSDIVFDEESLMALREKVIERQQNTEVVGMDSEPEYATLE